MVAYESNESGASGNTDVYVTTFPEGKGKWRVSTWARAIRFGVATERNSSSGDANDILYACAIKRNGDEIEVGTPQRLFRVYLPGVGSLMTSPPTANVCWSNLAEEEGQAPLRLLTNCRRS